MPNNDWKTAQAVGTIGVLASSWMLYRLVRYHRGLCHYTREAIYAVCCLLVSTAILRTLAMIGIIEHDETRVINGLAFVVFTVILLQVEWMHTRAHPRTCAHRDGGHGPA